MFRKNADEILKGFFRFYVVDFMCMIHQCQTQFLGRESQPSVKLHRSD